MKILTFLGTRPEIIRLSLTISKLDQLCRHVLVHTGQNFDPSLSDLLFRELGVRGPDHYLGVRAQSFAQQTGEILVEGERILLLEQPDKVLILGDTNSGLVAIVAKRLGIPVYHMEAGNRCFDDRVPEETNRRIIDHSSDVLLPYTERSRDNLLHEGIPGQRIYVTGNPIFEVIQHYDRQVDESSVLATLGLSPREFILVTMHRAENVDVVERLVDLMTALDHVQKAYRVPLIVSTHPRTRAKLDALGERTQNEHIRFLEPFGLFDFLSLERNALCVMSDSGTVQEECAIFGVPNVTIRDVTERPETLECGSNILSGVEPEVVLRCVRTATDLGTGWIAPSEYLRPHVSDTVCRIILGFLHA